MNKTDPAKIIQDEFKDVFLIKECLTINDENPKEDHRIGTYKINNISLSLVTTFIFLIMELMH